MIQDRNQGDSRDRAGGPDPRGHMPSPGDLSACLVPIRVCRTHQISMSRSACPHRWLGSVCVPTRVPHPPALPCPLLVMGPHCSPCPGAPHPPSGRRQLRSQDPVPDITVMSLTPGPSDVPPGALGPRPPTSCRQAAPQPSQGACRRRTQTGTGRCTPCWRRHPRSAWAGTGRGEGQWGGRGDGVRVKRQGPEGL